MKTLLEILLSLVLHPIALILMLVNLVGRTDIGGSTKIVWALIGLVWGIGPILYFTIGGGELW